MKRIGKFGKMLSVRELDDFGILYIFTEKKNNNDEVFSNLKKKVTVVQINNHNVFEFKKFNLMSQWLVVIA